MKPRLTTVVLCFLLALPMHAALSVTFDGSFVRVQGVTPRGRVAVMSTMREGGSTMITRLSGIREVLTDADGNGSVDYDLKRAIPRFSVWAVVDVASGESLITAPAGVPTNESALPAGFVKNAPADEFDTLIGENMVLDLLWVRPGNNGGAWLLRAADGGANDADGKSNGHAVLSTSAFLPLGDSGKAPKKLKKGDVLVLLDPFAMSSSRGVITQ